eukprot:TRINITY_DN854_c0_g1_i19.p1 TRINITY_DN854_c0_g1~~TRINITY_DN854_c0_g1_i19.p1  ORF type:complete len:204 (-),score=83.33 TRINITY_DN854_c0_g1_i19:206-817(-)
MEKEERPRRPLTPFFLFREREREKGNFLGGADAGDQWRSMTEDQKAPYMEEYRKAREKYDDYLISKGLPTKSSSKKKRRVTKYYSSRMETLCTRLKAEDAVFKGLSRAAEKFVVELGETVAEEMKAMDKRQVTVDIIAKVLEQPKFDFLNSMKEYDSIAAEAEKAVQDESERRSQRRKDSSVKKKKSRKSRKSKESESEEDSS